MTRPRRDLVPADAPSTQHCVSRCVRRAFLCGDDPITGRSFEHRKRWLESRILELGGLFAVAVHAYAVMSNHVHVVLDVDPQAPRAWSDEDVARRWLALCNGSGSSDEPLESRIRNLASNPERLAELRNRLGDLGWFMRFLKEPIARQANREDGCTGRFWEGRYRNQTVLDDPSVLAAMVYVDLNPLRAGVSTVPEVGPHTSLCRRIERGDGPDGPLTPVAASIRGHLPDLSFDAYLAIVRWTAGELHGDGVGAQVGSPPPHSLPLRSQQWLVQVPGTESRFSRALGSAQSLMKHAACLGQHWVHGIGAAREIDQIPDTS